MLLLGLGEQGHQVAARNMAGRLGIAGKGRRPVVELNGHGTVVDLIGDGKGGVVVVGGADEPDGIRHLNLAVKQVLGILVPGGGHQVKHPFVMAGHFQHGEHFGKIVLDSRQVHFVQNHHAGLFPVARLVQSPEELGLVEPLGEFVEVAQQLRPVPVGGLDGNHGGRVFQEAAEGMGKAGFTGTGNTFQNQQLGGSHARHKTADDLRGVIQVHLAASEEPVVLHQLLQGNLIVKDRPDIIGIFFVHQGQLGEPAGFGGDYLALLGLTVQIAVLDGNLGVGDLAADTGRCRGGMPRHIAQRGDGVVQQGRSSRVGHPLGAADAADLQRQNLVLLVNQVQHLPVQLADLPIELGVVLLVALQLPAQAHRPHQQHNCQNGHGNENQHQDNGQQLRRKAQSAEIGKENGKILTPAGDEQPHNRRDQLGNVVNHLRDDLKGEFQKITHSAPPPPVRPWRPLPSNALLPPVQPGPPLWPSPPRPLPGQPPPEWHRCRFSPQA